MLIRLFGTIRTLFIDSPLLNDGPFGESSGPTSDGGVGGGGGASSAGEPIGLLLALTKAS